MYEKLINDVSDLIHETENIKVAHEKVEPIKKTLIRDLKKYQTDFKIKAKQAQKLSEWDKYTIAFFGETNAGKSTIIESLRILGKENSKINEHEQIISLNNIIKDNTDKIREFEKEIVALEQEIATCEEHQSYTDSEISKREIEHQQKSDKKFADISQQATLENTISSLNSELIELEKVVYALNRQIQLCTEEIIEEEKKIDRKKASFYFGIKVWIGGLFGKNVVVNEFKLIKLKEQEVEIIQRFDKENSNLKSKINFKDKTTSRLETSKDSVQQLAINIEILSTELVELKDNCEKYKAKILSNFKVSQQYLKDKEAHQKIVTEKEQKLKLLGDGKIIGTGKQDFTIDVNSYELEYNEQTIVLIDVPGIEGDEDRYSEMIKNAVIKSHAIFYVNGSNKKPEEKTLDKIKSYLQDQSEVYSICNVKGKPDTYEFDDERESLSRTHKELAETASLTKKTLSSVLSDRYKNHLNIQGLIAFAGSSKFINSERKDLVRSYKKFHEFFETSESMLEFSNINSIESLIKREQPFFKEKIKISNFQTLIGISSRFIEELKGFKEKVISSDTINHLKREINGYKNEVNVNFDGLKSTFKNISSRLSNQFYNELQTFIHHIIDKKFDELNSKFTNSTSEVSGLISDLKSNHKDQDIIKKLLHIFLEQLSKKVQDEFRKLIEKELKDFFESLQNKKKRITTRLNNLSNVNNYSIESVSTQLNFDLLTEGIDFSTFLKEGVDVTLSIGGMAITGFTLGTMVPVIGNIVGAIIGGVLGCILYVFKLIYRGESREAKLKRDIEPQLNDAKKELLSCFTKVSNDSLNNVKNTIEKESELLNSCVSGLIELQSALSGKINGIKSLVNQLKEDKEKLEKSFIKKSFN